jgi:gamma-glutamyltranspeptidase/glutathione hydrolase
MSNEPSAAYAAGTGAAGTATGIGTSFAAVAGHPAGSAAAAEVFGRTGNIADAAVAATLVLAVVEPHLFGLGGEVTGLVHIDGTTTVLAGSTRAPRAMTRSAFGDLGIDVIPGDGLLAAGPPALLLSMVELLRRFGSASFDLVSAPARRLAADGMTVTAPLAAAIAAQAERFRDWWPESGAVWLAEGVPPPAGAVVAQPALAATLDRLAALDLAGVEEALRTGFVAEALLRFAKETHPSSVGSHASFLAAEDLADHAVSWEEPVVWTDRRGWQICKAGPWTQGPVLLLQRALLQAGGWDELPVHDPQLLHATIETLKLAMADREGYFCDPLTADVPLDALLDPTAVTPRAALVTDRALDQPPTALAGHRPWRGGPQAALGANGDTTHLDVVDGYGNAIALTPSGGWFSSPVVPDLGFPLGTRCQTFWLDAKHPNALRPGKRPRTTLTPTLVLDRGRLRYALGTPGGDSQDQIQAQLLHALGHGATPTEAVELATVVSWHSPSSFAPHGSMPLSVAAEGRVPAAAVDALAERGHHVRRIGDWEHGRPQVVEVTPRGLLAAGSRRLGGAGVAVD